MRYLERNLIRLNELLHLNYELEELYHETSKETTDDGLQVFLMQRALERKAYSEALKNQIVQMAGKPTDYEGLGGLQKRNLVQFKQLLEIQDIIELLHQICKVEALSVVSYNIFLQERHVPLSICKLLIEQRDKIQYTINSIKVKEALVA